VANKLRKLISSGSSFESAIGYSRAVVEGNWIFVSGTTGFNYDTMAISDDVAEQADQTFRNIKSAMEKGGFTLENIVRIHYILPDAKDFEPCWPVLKKYLGEIRPAATMFVAGLADPRMKIEIEVTGKKAKK
jgi:enamine deaminase RidA (YjgF/YER057c/UK114 family)